MGFSWIRAVTARLCNSSFEESRLTWRGVYPPGNTGGGLAPSSALVFLCESGQATVGSKTKKLFGK